MNCEEFVRMVGPVSEVFGLLNEYGQNMPLMERPDNYGRGPMKQCYRNAWNLAQSAGLLYCEGFASCGALGVPVEHAWVCDAEGNVFDPTWRDGAEYFGVALDAEFVANCLMMTGVYGVLCNAHRIRRALDAPVLPFLRSGLLKNAALQPH